VNGYPELDHFLRADPHDAGCARAKEILHGYAKLVAGASQRATAFAPWLLGAGWACACHGHPVIPGAMYAAVGRTVW
jgi:hypothetical protein